MSFRPWSVRSLGVMLVVASSSAACGTSKPAPRMAAEAEAEAEPAPAPQPACRVSARLVTVSDSPRARVVRLEQRCEGASPCPPLRGVIVYARLVECSGGDTCSPTNALQRLGVSDGKGEIAFGGGSRLLRTSSELYGAGLCAPARSGEWMDADDSVIDDHRPGLVSLGDASTQPAERAPRTAEMAKERLDAEESEWEQAYPTCAQPTSAQSCDGVRAFLKGHPKTVHRREAEALVSASFGKVVEADQAERTRRSHASSECTQQCLKSGGRRVGQCMRQCY